MHTQSQVTRSIRHPSERISLAGSFGNHLCHALYIADISEWGMLRIGVRCIGHRFSFQQHMPLVPRCFRTRVGSTPRARKAAGAAGRQRDLHGWRPKAGDGARERRRTGPAASPAQTAAVHEAGGDPCTGGSEFRSSDASPARSPTQAPPCRPPKQLQAVAMAGTSERL